MERDGCLIWVLDAYELIDDETGVYGGLPKEPQWQALVSEMREKRQALQVRLEREFPAILDPGHADWTDPRRIESGAALIGLEAKPS